MTIDKKPRDSMTSGGSVNSQRLHSTDRRQKGSGDGDQGSSTTFRTGGHDSRDQCRPART